VTGFEGRLHGLDCLAQGGDDLAGPDLGERIDPVGVVEVAEEVR
jgi:hypothetical protein